MITKIPNTPDAYREYWKTMAEVHTSILHDDIGAPRFVTINESMVNPFKGIDISELIQGQRSKLKYKNTDATNQKLLMVLTEFASDLKNTQSRPMDVVDGAILLLGKVTQNDADDKARVMKLAYDCARDLIAWMVQFWEVNQRLGKIDSVQIDPVGPIMNDNMYGYRVDFGWDIHTALHFDNERMSNYTPPTI